MSTDFEALVLTALVAGAYLLVLRIVDANEREPIWSLAFVLHLGIAAAVFLNLAVSDSMLELTILPSAVVREAASAGALLVACGVWTALRRLRGWSELTDMMDGIIYGAAAGLGVALGSLAVREVMRPDNLLMAPPFSAWQFAADAMLTGLAAGVSGAVTGIGFGAALSVSGGPARALRAFTGFLGAVAVHAGHEWFTRGNTLAGAPSVARAWIGLLAPLAFIGLAMWYAARRERRAIEAELEEEVTSGVVTAGELDLLRHRFRRQLAYLTAAAAGRMGRATRLVALHNRQVQLALAKRRHARLADSRVRQRLATEIAALRTSIATLRQDLAT